MFASAKKYSSRFFYLPLHLKVFSKRHFELLTFAATIGQHLARLGYGGIAIACFLVFHHLSLPITIIFLVLALFFMLVFGDFFPRFWAIRSPESVLISTASLASFFLFLTFPIAFLFLKGAEWSIKGEKEESIDPLEETKETVLGILRAANVKGKLNASDKKLLESVIRFKDRIVREVMVPRVDLFSLPVSTTIREAANLLVEEGYSRTPIYRETIDDIVGVLMFKDILEFYMNCETGKKDPALLNQSIESLVKGVFYTPETKKASHLLQEFRTKQMHMAIVIDEYGGTEGVVTIEDILEEIVGEIADEYDVDEETLYTTQPGGEGWVVDARMNIQDAEDTFNIRIPQEGEYDTIGGYIFHKIGSIPPKGLKIHHDDFDLEILNSTDRSIEKVKITPRKNGEE